MPGNGWAHSAAHTAKAKSAGEISALEAVRAALKTAYSHVFPSVIEFRDGTSGSGTALIRLEGGRNQSNPSWTSLLDTGGATWIHVHASEQHASEEGAVIRSCGSEDLPVIEAIINDAAEAYRGVIPADCWHEPYMRRSELISEVATGVKFSGWDDGNCLVGVMGLQSVQDVTLIRHAYVRPSHQGCGIGGLLLDQLAQRVTTRLLVGTWADAVWALRFYQRHRFELVSRHETNTLLDRYWRISPRQRDTSVVLQR
jgi:GNAT superfamily N-acetyltransferase